jgi:hypothetical protein
MTESDWLACTYPSLMLGFLKGRASDRKLRLFASACQRRIWRFLEAESTGRRMIQALERIADDVIDGSELPGSLNNSKSHDVAAILSRDAALSSARLGLVDGAEESRMQVALLRDLLGNPFRPGALNPAWLSWHGGTIPKLAEAIYEDRVLPSGHLDNHRLTVLADALEDAGCTDQDILGHCRGPGPHVRGCWVVDLVLGKS